MSPPLDEQGSCSCGPTHSDSVGLVADGALLGAHSGWVFVGSCRNPASHTRAWWRRRSPDLALGSKAGGLDSEAMALPVEGTEGSGLAELQGVDAAEKPGRSEGSLGTGRREDDPALQSAGWSSWLPRVP